MATPGDTIAIESVTALDMAGRFNTIKFTFTGVASLALVRLFDSNEVLIAELVAVESGVEYAIETGENVGASSFTFFAMPPMPVHIIHFLPSGEDVTDPTAVITGIFVGTRTTQKVGDIFNLVLQEVKDDRFHGGTAYGNIVGGTPAEWPRDPVTGMYYELGEGTPPNTFDYISKNHLVVIEAVTSNGELLPIIGQDQRASRINLGMHGTEAFTKYSQSVK